jgi:putative endonuclease
LERGGTERSEVTACLPAGRGEAAIGIRIKIFYRKFMEKQGFYTLIVKTGVMNIYFVYIITNACKTVLYIGVTNDLGRRLSEHRENRGKNTSFAGKYYCCHLLYYEEYDWIGQAMKREKELKKWPKEKKEQLISNINPSWRDLDAIFVE